MHLMHHHIHLHLPHCVDALKKDINGIYAVHSIRGFIFSLFGIFIPIYLLTLGFSLTAVLLFYIVRRLVLMTTAFFFGKAANNFGIKHTMLASLPLALIYLVLLSSLKYFPSNWFLFSVSVFGGIQASLYWIPLHSLFTRYTKNGNRCSRVGKLLSFQHIATMIAPLLGGLITYQFGFEALFVVAFFLLLIPIGLLLHSPEVKPHSNFNFKDGLHLLRKYKRHYFHVAVDLMGQNAESILWPIFIFLVLQSELAIGLVGTLVGVGTIVFTLFIGKRTNRNNRAKIIKISAFLLAVIWAMKYFAASTAIIYFLSIIAGFFLLMFSVPNMSETYELAKKEKNSDEFIIFREIPVALGSSFILLLAILVADKIELSFIATSLNFFLLLFI